MRIHPRRPLGDKFPRGHILVRKYEARCCPCLGMAWHGVGSFFNLLVLTRICEPFCGWMLHPYVRASQLSIYRPVHQVVCHLSEHLSISSYPHIYFLIHEPAYSSFHEGIWCPHLSAGEDGKTKTARSLCPQADGSLVDHIHTRMASGCPEEKPHQQSTPRELRQARTLCRSKWKGLLGGEGSEDV